MANPRLESVFDKAVPFSSSSSATSAQNPPVYFDINAALNNAVPFSSSSTGPNTVDAVKSSSTAPATTETKATPPAKPKGDGKKKPPKKDAEEEKKEDTPQVDHTYQSYQPPKKDESSTSQQQQTREDYTMNWVDPNQQQPATDEHRTVLQALMGWDDVPAGQRWHHFVEHGFTGMHGSKLDELMKLVHSEDMAGAGGKGSYGQELRAKESHRKSILGQWDKLLQEWNSGRYSSGDKYTVQEFFKEADRLRKEYAAAGFNPNELRRPAINAGGFAQGFQKDLQADRSKLDWIGGWLNDIQQNIANNPAWLNSTQAQMYFDKLSEYTILNMAQSRGAIADAEKIRAQVESMPYADRQVYDKFMNMFFNANLIAQVESLANAGNRDAQAYLQNMDGFIHLSDGGAGKYSKVKEDGSIELGNESEHYGNAAILLLDKLQGVLNNPIDLANAVTSYKNVKDAFQQYTMQNANVDREMVWNTAIAQYNIYKNQYNSKLPELGLLWGWEHKGPELDQNLGGYLKNWQEKEYPNRVMQDAKLAYGNPPKPTEDPAGATGGGGGNANQRPSGVPDNAVYDKKNRRWAWKVRGQWKFHYGKK